LFRFTFWAAVARRGLGAGLVNEGDVNEGDVNEGDKG